MIIIGSVAYPKIRTNFKMTIGDVDCMLTKQELLDFIQYNNITPITFNETYCHFMLNNLNYEMHIANNDSTQMLLDYCNNEIGKVKSAPINVLYMLKLSHRYKKNSKHFLKTMYDINYFKSIGATLDDRLKEILTIREKETYTYSHPNLNVDKATFFDGDGINYIFDHDSIHDAVKLYDKPAYMYYIMDNKQVFTDKQKFFSLPLNLQLAGVYEECCVLALERSQIPYNFEVDAKRSFKTALMKVCTSITSGWFREFAYDHYTDVIKLYKNLGENNYIIRFNENKHLLKPFLDKNKVSY